MIEERCWVAKGPVARNARELLSAVYRSLLTLGFRAVGVREFGRAGEMSEHEAGLFDDLCAFYEFLPMWLKSPACRALLGWGTEWVRGGMPQVVPDAKLAASLMATVMPGDVIAAIALPWPAFSVVVPPGLVTARDADGAEQSITRAHALFANGEVRIIGTSDNSRNWTGPIQSIVALAEAPCIEGQLAAGEYTSQIDAADARALQVLGRLVLGVCAEMSSPAMRESVRIGQPRRAHRKRRSQEPTVWSFRLSRPVKVDARRAVIEFVEGTRSSLATQHVVRGHWKMQASGPGGRDRAAIHIEPYWRGPEDAPILARPYKVGP